MLQAGCQQVETGRKVGTGRPEGMRSHPRPSAEGSSVLEKGQVDTWKERAYIRHSKKETGRYI
jgi:hypothetical protein